MIGQILAERYEILRAIGRGGTANVYLAREREPDREVAIKIVRSEVAALPQALLRFENEAKVISRLRHPNTIRVLDSGRTERGDLFIVTEYLSGRSVAEELEAGPMEIDRLVRIAEQVCASLAEAHAEGIVHRDIKPDNIFVDDRDGEPNVKLIDFGVAKLRDNLVVTAPDILLGTILYVSPEQAGRHEVDHRSDLYSLGVTMFQMATGQPPFSSEKVFDILRGHLFEAAPSMRELRSDLPAELEALIVRMMAKDPAERTQSAEEVRAALEEMRRTRSLAAEGPVPSFDDEAPTQTRLDTVIVERGAPRRSIHLGNAFLIPLAVAVLAAVAFLGTILLDPAPELPERAEIAVEPIAEMERAEAPEAMEQVEQRVEQLEQAVEPEQPPPKPVEEVVRKARKPRRPVQKQVSKRAQGELPGLEVPQPLPIDFEEAPH